jgi:hypothetical protein
MVAALLVYPCAEKELAPVLWIALRASFKFKKHNGIDLSSVLAIPKFPGSLDRHEENPGIATLELSVPARPW